MLTLPAKAIRAQLIRDHLGGGVAGANAPRVVVFTCGNAAAQLRAVGLDVLAVGPGQELQAGRWWTPAEIRAAWPDRFDATSGHLPMHLVAQLAMALADHVGTLERCRWLVPTGSGETITALRWVYPDADLVALTGTGPNTDHHPDMPLAPLVARLPVMRADGLQLLPALGA